MKMYYFNPNDYDKEYFVLAENKSEACAFLLEHIKKCLNKSIEVENEFMSEIFKKELNRWEKVEPSKPQTYPSGYTIEEYGFGQVIESEIS